jgi:light-regulated signal transduction histidine kinase (bacteriophytochrome)
VSEPPRPAPDGPPAGSPREVKPSAEALERELKDLAQALSHDLRAPLRALEGFSRMLLEQHQEGLDEQGRDYLRRLREASAHMSRQIEGLTRLARVSAAELRRQPVDLGVLAREQLGRLAERDPGRTPAVTAAIDDGLVADADAILAATLLEVLLANAWKFTRGVAAPRIEVSREQADGQAIWLVRDNGAGFDTRYAERLFHPFARLHRETEFEGLGIGLAVARRVVNRHGGRVWAQAVPGAGATFYFTFQ